MMISGAPTFGGGQHKIPQSQEEKCAVRSRHAGSTATYTGISSDQYTQHTHLRAHERVAGLVHPPLRAL